MSFTSLPFLGLTAATVVLYGLLPRRARWAALLAASAVFYASGGVSTLLYLLFTAGTTYAAGLLLGRWNRLLKGLTPEEKAARAPALKRNKKLTAAAACLLNFGLLFLVKYWDFTAAGLERLTGAVLPRLELLLPLGLSFYIFQAVGYVIDCYRGKYAPERNFAKFSLFISFFPQLVQGPISRFHQLAPQLTRGDALRAEHLKAGLQLMLAGYLKKMVLADRAAVAVNTIFGDYLSYGGIMTALGVAFYCIQLYCDFSGGIDITRGVARLFGIDMAENFRRPIFADTLSEYWRRWHITLGNWMRDYLFYPLSLSKPFVRLGKRTRRRPGGKLGKIIPTSLATFLIYLVIGLWHGANFRYIAFGLYNGALMTAGLLLAGPFTHLKERLHFAPDSRGLRFFGILRTMLIVFAGRYLSRAPRLLTALQMLWRTVSMPCLYQLRDGTILRLGLGLSDLLVVALGTLILLALEYYQERGGRLSEALERQNVFVQWLWIVIPLTALLFFGIFRDSGIQSEFIYRQF